MTHNKLVFLNIHHTIERAQLINQPHNLKNYVPLEGRKLKPVESSYSLARFAKHTLELNEAESEIGDFSPESPTLKA